MFTMNQESGIIIIPIYEIRSLMFNEMKGFYEDSKTTCCVQNSNSGLLSLTFQYHFIPVQADHFLCNLLKCVLRIYFSRQQL